MFLLLYIPTYFFLNSIRFYEILKWILFNCEYVQKLSHFIILSDGLFFLNKETSASILTSEQSPNRNTIRNLIARFEDPGSVDKYPSIYSGSLHYLRHSINKDSTAPTWWQDAQSDISWATFFDFQMLTYCIGTPIFARATKTTPAVCRCSQTISTL